MKIHSANVGSPDFRARSGITGHAPEGRFDAVGRGQCSGMNAPVQRNATQPHTPHEERRFGWP